MKLRVGMEFRPFRFQVTTSGKLFTHVCLCHQAAYSFWCRDMPCGREGNRRTGVALAMRHAHGPRKGDEHPDYNLHGV